MLRDSTPHCSSLSWVNEILDYKRRSRMSGKQRSGKKMKERMQAENAAEEEWTQGRLSQSLLWLFLL